ncbi:MAG TPA: hypothetical protein GX717_06255 [Clostridiaceae bacterium]|nr:hypothetical protein [Clostridiaceae bacterium]
MSAIGFMLKCRAKNWFKSLRKQPGQLVFFIFMIVMALLPIIIDTNDFTQMVEEARMSEGVLGRGITLLIFCFVEMLTFAIILQMGLTKGVNIFSKADVEYLFCSHIAPQRVLLYGLVSYLKVIPLYFLIMVYQIPTLLQAGLRGGQIALLMLVLALMSVTSGVVTMFIFNLINMKAKLKPFFTAAIYILLFAVFFGWGLEIVPLIKAGASFEGPIVQALLDVRWIDWIPLVGWTIGLTHGVIVGMTLAHWLQLCLLLGTGVLIVVYLTRTEMDFYESSALSAELLELREKKMGVKKGTIFNQQNRSWDTGKASRFLKKDKLKSGIDRGWGPIAIFHRQQVEEKRRRPFGFGINTVILFLLAIALQLFFPHLGAEVKMSIYIFIFSYDMLFFIGTSTLQDELENDNFYYLPGRPVQKVFAAMLSGFLARCKDALPGVILLGIWSGLAPLRIILTLFVFISVILSLQSQSVMATAIFGGTSSGILFNLLRVLIGMFFLAPIVGGGVVAIVQPELYSIVFAIIIVINLILSCVIFPASFSLLKKGKA